MGPRKPADRIALRARILKDLRELTGATQADFGDLLGTNATYIGFMEKQRMAVKPSSLRAILMWAAESDVEL